MNKLSGSYLSGEITFLPVRRVLQYNKAEVTWEVFQQVQVVLNHSQPPPRLETCVVWRHR